MWAKDKDKLIHDIYEKYHKMMFYVAHNILQDEMWAEDAVQEAMIRIMNNSSKIEHLDDNRTKRMIVVITKNIAIDIYRKRMKQFQNETDIESHGELTDFTSSNDILFDDGQFEILQGIPSIYMDVLLLKYASEYSNKEISQILNISEINVRKRLSRGKKIIKHRLKEKNYER